MELPASFVGLNIPSSYSGHYSLAPSSDNIESRKFLKTIPNK